jgi:hypothetical protein
LQQEIQVSPPVTKWSRNFSPSLLYRWRNVRAEVMCCTFSFSVRILCTHLTQNLRWCSVSATISHSNVREICGNHPDNSDNVNWRFSELFFNFSFRWAAIAIFVVHVSSAIFQLSNSLPHFALTHYNWPINGTQMLKNFCCSKIICIQNPHHCKDWTTSGIFD